MATSPQGAPTPSGGLALIKRFLKRQGAVEVLPRQGANPPPVVNADGWDDWTGDPVSLQFLQGSAERQIRSRQQVYEKWQDMIGDPVVSGALRLHVTAALGGDENTGEMVYIEATPEAKKDPKLLALVESMAKDLQPLFNRIAPTVSFNACAFGDAYGRIYADPKTGVRDVYTDELVYPPLIQPYERGNATIGYTIATGNRVSERLSVLQIARMKMPRQLYVPQNRVIEKAMLVSLTTDRIEDLPAVPALAGGSFLDGAEGAYDKFNAAWAGLTGQRVRDSIDEAMVSVQQAGMNPAQRATFKRSLEDMFNRSNAYINEVVKKGRAVVGRIIHFIPTNSDKQLTEIRGPVGSGSAQSSLTIEDVMMNARMLAGALGTDLSMLGFADLLSGGLGDGGFFRVSAQSAERARAIRSAGAGFFNHVAKVHALYKHRIDFAEGELPWRIAYYSGIASLETERAKTKADNMNSAALLAQTLQQLKEMALDEAVVQDFLETEMGMDAKRAKQYAKAIVKAAEAAKAEAAGGGFGGGPGGAGDEGMIPGAEPGTPGGGVVPTEG
jgi:hypothetical protein